MVDEGPNADTSHLKRPQQTYCAVRGEILPKGCLELIQIEKEALLASPDFDQFIVGHGLAGFIGAFGFGGSRLFQPLLSGCLWIQFG